MPDDYYVSQYSGEEIDALLGGAGAGTVRYDAAQSLTDEQKTQARTNINSAPGGFGWGDSAQYTFETNEEFKAWFMQNAALKCVRNAFAASVHIMDVSGYRMLIIASGNSLTSEIVIVGYLYNGYELRVNIDGNGNWQPWEWVNPAMQLGVEYRTTERVAGKPVYTKLVDFGALPNATAKEVAFASSIGCKPIRVSAYVYKLGDTARYEVINGGCLPTSFGAPSSNDIWLTAFQQGSAAPQIYMYSSKNLSSRYAYAQIWYIKDSD